MASFRQLRKFLGPMWLTEGDGELVGYSLDLIKDAFLDRLRFGLLARFPQNGPNGETAPDDALAATGRDRRIIRGSGETSASYAARLIRWLDDAKTRGNPYALMQKLAEYMGTRGGSTPSFRTVDNSGNWYSRAADGTTSVTLATGNWNWDNDATKWSRFWVVIYPNGYWTKTSDHWADGHLWGETNRVWGSNATPEDVTTIRALIADWKPAGTRCVNIIIGFDPASFNPAAPEPDGLWFRNGKSDGFGNRIYSRLATANYWSGV